MESGIGRRDALRRTFLALAGLLGLGLVQGAGATAGPAQSAQPHATSLELWGSDWHRESPTSDVGAAPESGERASQYGRILGSPSGPVIGEFRAATFLGDAAALGSHSASLEFHTFTLGDDVIFGMGTASDTGSTFAVVGGSGKYLGARGSYVAQQSPFEVGGDGTARFVFTLL